MKIEILGGTSPRLYKLVAPLVMNAAVLRQNDNYPYKTSQRHEWLLALDDEDENKISGFFPVERREGYAYINNYYLSAEAEESVFAGTYREIHRDVCPDGSAGRRCPYA